MVEKLVYALILLPFESDREYFFALAKKPIGTGFGAGGPPT